MRDKLFNHLPPMLTGEELIRTMTVLPAYNASMMNRTPAVRLIALNDLYKLYIPSSMSLEIYSKLYLALLRSLQKKGKMDAVRQKYENQKAIRQQAYTGIIGGSDSFTIIGASGIGKSTAISRALDLITANGIMEQNDPYVRRRSALTPAVIEWLYAHSAGVISVVVSLIHDAQEIAILDGREELNLPPLNEAYQKRLTMLHSYMQPEEKKPTPSAKQRKLVRTKRTVSEEAIPIAALAEKAKREQLDIVNLLKQHVQIEEVRV